MPYCSSCGSPLGEDARFCWNCGAEVSGPPVTPQSASVVRATPAQPPLAREPSTISVAAWFVVGAGLLMAVGSFLPWVHAQALAFAVDRNGFQLGKNMGFSADGLCPLIFGVLVAVIGLSHTLRFRLPSAVQRSAIFLSLWVALWCGYDAYAIDRDIISKVNLSQGMASAGYGYGLYLVFLGCVIGFVAGLVVWSARRAEGKSVSLAPSQPAPAEDEVTAAEADTIAPATTDAEAPTQELPVASAPRRRRVRLALTVIGMAVLAGAAGAGATFLYSHHASSRPLLTAAQVVARMKNLGLPIGQVASYTQANDPNHLLGRPGQYIGKTNFSDTQLAASVQGLDDGTVEVFANASDAAARKAYIDAISRAMPSVGYYSYQSGRYLLRVAFALPVNRAQAYQAAFLKVLTGRGSGEHAATVVAASPSPTATASFPLQAETLPVHVLATSQGVQGNPAPIYPATITVRVPSPWIGQVAAYGVAGVVLLAPAGWYGTGLLAADGSYGATLHAASASAIPGQMTFEVDENGPAIGAAAAYFPWVQSGWSQWGTGGPAPTTRGDIDEHFVSTHLARYAVTAGPQVNQGLHVNGAVRVTQGGAWSFERLEMALPPGDDALAQAIIDCYLKPVTSADHDICWTLRDYFVQVNAHDYPAAWRDLSPTFHATTTLSQWAAGMSTTADSNVVIHNIRLLTKTTAVASVAFTSTQDSSHGPNGDLRDRWSLDYSMRRVGWAWLLDKASGRHTTVTPAPTSNSGLEGGGQVTYVLQYNYAPSLVTAPVPADAALCEPSQINVGLDPWPYGPYDVVKNLRWQSWGKASAFATGTMWSETSAGTWLGHPASVSLTSPTVADWSVVGGSSGSGTLSYFTHLYIGTVLNGGDYVWSFTRPGWTPPGA